jgi:hypothetical protein
MIPWKGNSGGAGSVPHLSFVKRKPEPLGVELKTVCDCTTGATSSSFVCRVNFGEEWYRLLFFGNGIAYFFFSQFF